MDDTSRTLPDAFQRRAQAFHALAAMDRGPAHASSPLFGRRAPANEASVRRHEGALQVTGKVPVDCLKVGCVMD